MRFAIVLLLAICGSLKAANDFSADANCVALWRFENGALTTDSKGTNTLIASGTPIADTVNFQEGAASVDLEATENDYFWTLNSSLDAGFPGKSGDTNKKLSVCCWVKPESLPIPTSPEFGYGIIANIGQTNKFSWNVTINEDSGSHYASLRIGYNSGGNWEDILHTGVALSAGQWYHWGITYQDSDKSYRIRVWDGVSATESTGTSTNNINIEDGWFVIERVADRAAYGRYDGLIDELVVFNDVLTADEIDYVRAGTYPTGAPPGAGGGQVIIVEME